MKKIFTLLLGVLCFSSVAYAEQVAYRRPPQDIEELATASTHEMKFNKDYTAAIIMYANRNVPIEEVPVNGLRIAGLRVDPNRYCRTRERGYNSIALKQLPKGEEVKVSGLPENCAVLRVDWYPTGDKVLMFVREKEGIYLYSASFENSEAVRVSESRINTVASKFLLWVNDTDFITACVVEGVEKPTQGTPTGPLVQESLGKKTRSRTVQGLLRTNYDVECLEHYFTSQLTYISPSEQRAIGDPAIYRTINISPNREYLMIYRVVEPYLYNVSFKSFKSKTTIEDLEGNVIKEVKQRGNLAWRPDKPATLVWSVKAKKDADYKNAIYEQEAPFDGKRRLVIRTSKPFSQIYWGNDEMSLLVEKDKGMVYISSFKPGNSEVNTFITYNGKIRHENVGDPIMVTNEYGRKVLWTNEKNNEVIFHSKGYTLNGHMPELVLYKMDKEKQKVIWKCKAPYYEKVVEAVDPTNRIFITTRESLEEPKNYYLCDFKKKSKVALSDFPDPFPSLKGATRKFLVYEREDGVMLHTLVWLPAGYDAKRDGRLPILMSAYPQGFKSAEAAAYPLRSQYTHASPSSGAMLFFLNQGYCVAEPISMPIIPTDDNKKGNDSFIKQLRMNAEAAINALAKAGYGDPDRVAISGHSYGAFMTANLLAHTKLFRAGIARSGAYNRSLTPYGFQDESRNYWGARKLYQEMSPFNYAHKLNGALIMFHGSNDDNDGTHTMQSERFFQALRGHKKFVRYVEFPLDGHVYAIEENVLHYLYEANSWLEKYVKNAADTTPEDEKKKDDDDNND